MSNETILDFAKTIHYAALVVDTASPAFMMHYGKQNWHRQIDVLTEEQRNALIAKIEQWKAISTAIQQRSDEIAMIMPRKRRLATKQ